MEKPIISGFSFGLTFWGLSEFKKLNSIKKQKDNMIVFKEDSYYTRDDDLQYCNTYRIEGFVIHNKEWKKIY